MSAALEFAALKRQDLDVWQGGVAGGDQEGENALQAAIRESQEELGVSHPLDMIQLSSCSSIPVYHFKDRINWSADLFVIPEYTFGMNCSNVAITLSDEHTQIRWGTYKEIIDILCWDSNKTALWELNERLKLMNFS